MRLVSLTLLCLSFAAVGCSSLYVPKAGTPNEEVSASVTQAQSTKEARVQAEIEAAAKAEAEGEAAWKKAQDDYLATLSPARKKWFKGVLAKPRVTIGMKEQEIKLLIHWKVDAKIVVTTADMSDAKKVGEVTVWAGVPLPGPTGGGHKGTLTVTFRKGKVVAVETTRA
jgi:hypothetical protein